MLNLPLICHKDIGWLIIGSITTNGALITELGMSLQHITFWFVPFLTYIIPWLQNFDRIYHLWKKNWIFWFYTKKSMCWMNIFTSKGAFFLSLRWEMQLHLTFSPPLSRTCKQMQDRMNISKKALREAWSVSYFNIETAKRKLKKRCTTMMLESFIFMLGSTFSVMLLLKLVWQQLIHQDVHSSSKIGDKIHTYR